MSLSFSNLFTFFHSLKISTTSENDVEHHKISPKSSPNTSPKLSLLHPASFPEYEEETFSDNEKEIEATSFVVLSPVPSEISITSFRTTYDYYSIVNIINKKLRRNKYIFDKSRNFWLLELDQNTVLRISIFELYKIRVIEVFSLNKKENFWKIYKKLKDKLNNIQDKDNSWLLDYSASSLITKNYVEDIDK
jgi:hypothetical protein